jgi:hypothetical protein
MDYCDSPVKDVTAEVNLLAILSVLSLYQTYRRTEIARWKATPKLYHPVCKSKKNKTGTVRVT